MGRATTAGPAAGAISLVMVMVMVTVMGLALSAGADAVAAPTGDALIQESKGVVVDWRRGILIAHAGAAGDLRMPSAEIARAGAQRRAGDAGRARLGEALRSLPLGGGRRLDAASIDRALQRAQPKRIEYQSNGGVLLDLELPFGAWNDPVPTPSGQDAGAVVAGAAPSVALRLTEGPLAAEPTLLVGETEMTLGNVRYALASELPADSHPLVVRADKKGRLVSREAGASKDLALRNAVIYVQKILR